MGDQAERYQLAGLDARERGFSRPVELLTQTGGWCAVLRYESVRVQSAPAASAAEAIQNLVRHLHEQGYRQLKSQLSYRAGEYLGNRELWVDYRDPVPAPSGWWARVRAWFGAAAARSSVERGS